jgi:hypothetical protein
VSSSVPAPTASRAAAATGGATGPDHGRPVRLPRQRPAAGAHPAVETAAIPAAPAPVPCPACGQGLLTTLRMTLTDGTPAVFTSCRRCEAKHWTANGAELTRDEVLTRTRKR